MILFGSPSCFKETDDTSWHVEEEEGEDDYGHHPDHDEDHPEAYDPDIDILMESCQASLIFKLIWFIPITLRPVTICYIIR